MYKFNHQKKFNMQNSILAYKEIAPFCGILKETDFPLAAV